MHKHQMIFKFLTINAIQIANGELAEEEHQFLKNFVINNPTTTYTQSIDALAAASEQLKGVYPRLLINATQNETVITKWLADKSIKGLDPPKIIIGEVRNFSKLLFISLFKPNLLYWAIQEYVAQFKMTIISNEDADKCLLQCINTPSHASPIMIICGKNMDPTQYFCNIFAQKDGKDVATIIKHIDQVCTKEFMEKYEEMRLANQTLIIQSTHLNPIACDYLEEIYNDLSEKHNSDKVEVNSNFRIVIFTELTANLPTSIPSNCKKFGYQYKELLKEKMKNCISTIKEEELSTPQRKLVFAMVMMHGMLINRTKYSFLTWSTLYKYTHSMYECGVQFILENYNTDEPNLSQFLPFFCDASYGGVIKDCSDLNALYSICRNYLNNKVLGSQYAFSNSEKYIVPEKPTVENMLKQISTMPELEYGDLYSEGEFESLHYEKLYTSKIKSMFFQILQIAQHPTYNIDTILANIAKELPPIIKETDLCETIKSDRINESPITMHFMIERGKANALINCVLEEINTISKHLDFQEFLKYELKASLMSNSVPKAWSDLSFPSSHNLSNWLAALKFKVNYIKEYLKAGTARCFILGGMFSPSSFIAAIKLCYIKKGLQSSFITAELTNYETMNDVPTLDNTFYFSNLLMIRGRINENMIEDSLPGQESSRLPIVAIFPHAEDEKQDSGMYECPVFITKHRKNTTDQSNFLMNIKCPTFAFADYWALKGVAILCSLK